MKKIIILITTYFLVNIIGTLLFFNITNTFAEELRYPLPSGYSEVAPSGTYYIKNTYNNEYIDIHGPSTSSGAYIHTWVYHPNLYENWTISSTDDGYYTFKSPYSNKYIGLDSTNTGSGKRNIKQYSTINNYTKWKIYTKSEDLPAVKIGSKAQISQALLSNGSIVAGNVKRSVLSPGVIVHPNATVINSVILNGTEIHEGAHIENAIIDKNSVIGKNVKIGVGENIPNIERPDLLSSGITVVGKSVHIPDNTQIGKNVRIFTTAKFASLEIKSGETLK